MNLEEYSLMQSVEDQHWWYATLHQQVLDAVQEYTNAKPVKILDAGCGTGGMLAKLTAHQTTGVDLSTQAISLCQQRGLTQVQLGSIHEMPFADDSFEIVLSLDVLYHQQVDETRTMAEMVRVLKPDGLLILNLPAHECLRGSHDAAVCGARRYNSCHVAEMLAAHNMSLTMSYHWNAWLFPILLCWRSWSRHCQTSAKSDLSMPPSYLNKALTYIARADAKLCSHYRSKIGSSLFVITRKNPRTHNL